MTFQIACGQSKCMLLPMAGGSIGSWNVAGQDMFRRADSEADPLRSSSFPLVPYSNRIAQARFDWEGEPVGLRAHEIALPHAIHGVGWQRVWEVSKVSADAATLHLRHPGDSDWPWPFDAEQQVSVGPDWLDLRLIVRNYADSPVPLAFGHHPYFDATAASLRFDARRFFPAGLDNLPLLPEPISSDTDFAAGRAVAEGSFDNLFGEWSGKARIEWQGRALALEIQSDLPHAVIFTPTNADFFCFEPVPHINNALNRDDGDMPLVAPGESATAFIRFSAIPA